MSLPKFLDTQEWAKAQDRIFAGDAEPHTISRFYPLLLTQEEITPSNLTLRHRLINAGWGALASDVSLTNLEAAASEFQALRKGDYWAEGYSYWEYTKVGLDWYDKRHGLPAEILDALARISAAYAALMPCPFPEVSNLGNPVDGPDFVSTPDYYRKLWKRDGKVVAALWVCLNTDPEPRLNLHHHMEAGYFAFWIGDGIDLDWTWPTWMNRCKPYTGFDFKESLTSSAFAPLLPKGAMPPEWRAKPPKVTVRRLTSSRGNPLFRFKWDNGILSKQTRSIEVYPDKVVVIDGGLFRRDKVTEYGV